MASTAIMKREFSLQSVEDEVCRLFGRNVRRAREAEGLSLNDLEDRIFDVNESSEIMIEAVESSNCNLTLDQVAEIIFSLRSKDPSWFFQYRKFSTPRRTLKYRKFKYRVLIQDMYVVVGENARSKRRKLGLSIVDAMRRFQNVNSIIKNIDELEKGLIYLRLSEIADLVWIYGEDASWFFEKKHERLL